MHWAEFFPKEANVTNNVLKPDGERFLPEFSGTIELEHYHRYFVALDLVKDKSVLDIASGEGFGSEILSRQAKSVIGVDISADAVAHANMKYSRDTLNFAQGSATEIPLPDQSVDIVVSFETIEHLSDHSTMMSEIKRVLKPKGLLLISSPNKLIYSDKPEYVNPFHVRELYTADFSTLVSRYFRHARHFGQRVVSASIIAGSDQECRFKTYNRSESTPDLAGQMYDIILASDEPLPTVAHSIYEEPDGPLEPRKIEALHQDYIRTCNELESLREDYIRISNEVEVLRQEAEDLALSRASDHRASEQHVAEITVQKAEIEARLEKILPKYAEVLERVRLQEAAMEAMAEDANRVLSDKWWRRTRSLRRWSNSLRKLKGKPKKHFPTAFQVKSYFADNPPVVAPTAEEPLIPDPQIPLVEYSSIDEGYVAYDELPEIVTSPKLIAFYLPQFHPFQENDAWWGKGFTEWTNVGKAKPLFDGHHQPHCPIHLGYYDLRIPEIMEEQARLARSYGVSGFAYYFYWFAGKVLMETPLKQMLNNPRVDIPFCMIWANENWTRRWDGQENDVLIAQDHSIADSSAMLDYLRPFMEDPRYIRIDGKPLFIIYRAAIIPDMAQTLETWRRQAEKFGFPGLYIVCAQTFGHRDPREYGFDAAMEFPPHTVRSNDIAHLKEDLELDFGGSIFDYEQVVTNAVQSPADEYKVFPTATLSWDNTARKGKKATIFSNFSMKRYSQWLSRNAERVAKNTLLSADEKIMFVNAWNEWAEGTHLEPDQKHGFGYLAATRSVMENYGVYGVEYHDPVYPKEARSKYGVISHLHYESTWADLSQALSQMDRYSPDVFVTVTSLHLAQIVKRDFPKAVVELVDNRGRDIRPFLKVYRKISQLEYSGICKIHGKASAYRSDGSLLRVSAFNALLADECFQRMKAEDDLGLLVPRGSLIEHNDKNMFWNGPHTSLLAGELGLREWRGNFPAGSMFWFKPEALLPLLKIGEDKFDVERGLADGTMAHAVERLFGSICTSQGFRVSSI